MKMNENIKYLLDCLEGDLLDLRELIENEEDKVLILNLIKRHMIPQLEEIASEI